MISEKERTQIIKLFSTVFGSGLPADTEIREFDTVADFKQYFENNLTDFKETDIALIGQNIFYFNGEFYKFSDYDLKKVLRFAELLDENSEPGKIFLSMFKEKFEHLDNLIAENTKNISDLQSSDTIDLKTF